jgi:hypothetical protein
MITERVTPWLRERKGVVKQGRRLVAGGPSRPSLAPWSVGQLAPLPDLTRQCAFDLRSRLEILSS